jgi:hypothetical protein
MTLASPKGLVFKPWAAAVCRGVPRAQPIATPMSLTLSPEPGPVAMGRVGDPVAVTPLFEGARSVDS